MLAFKSNSGSGFYIIRCDEFWSFIA